MTSLTAFEFKLLDLILNSNPLKYGLLEKQIPFLRVKSREFSPVGGYINFCLSENNLEPNNFAGDYVASAPNVLRVRGTDDFMSFELDITKGYINFMELVVDGRWQWNGNFDNMEVRDYTIPPK